MKICRLIALLPLVALVESRALEISIGSTNTPRGSTALIPITFSNVPATPISAFALYLTSTNDFGLPSVTPGEDQANLTCFVDDFSVVNGGTTQLAYRVTGLILNGASISNGHVATLHFSVPANAEPGNYPISFTGVPTNAPPGANPEMRSLVSNTLVSSTAWGGAINVLIPGAPATVTHFAAQPGNIFLLQFSGTAGARYTIEATTNLMAPISWLPLTNLSADGSGFFEFIDFDFPLYSNRFFRAVHP